MIKVYPVTIEAYDTEFMDKPVFIMKAFDECSAHIEMDTIIAPGKSTEELCAAITEAIGMLKLEEVE